MDNDYDKAIELNSNDYKIYCDRGIAKFYLNDYVGAIDDFDKAIKKIKDFKLKIVAYFLKYLLKFILILSKKIGDCK